MKKSWMMTGVFLFVGIGAQADQLRDYGPGRTASELRESGFSSRVEDRKYVYERRRDGSTVERIVSAQGFYVSAMISNPNGSEISFVELEKLGKAVSRTKCKFDGDRKKYFCSTQNNTYCKALASAISNKQVTTGLMKVLHVGKAGKSDIDQVLAQIPYDSVTIEKAQRAGVEKISQDFQMPLSKFVIEVPKKVQDFETLAADHAECQTMNNAWFGSLWAPSESSSPQAPPQKEIHASGRR